MSDFIEEAITAAAVELDISLKEDNQYACIMTSPHGKMVRDITVKPGYDAPTLGNVIYHYALVAQEVSQYDDVLEWADDTGHKLSDSKTLPKFRQMVDDKRDLRLLLSESIYQDMMGALEISQAICNANH
ncbi:MAG TPA: hypothetical protein ENI91_02125 [Sphingomonadales bacterium]|nr:hypothetical protein [Sphingomonadales bacterium]